MSVQEIKTTDPRNFRLTASITSPGLGLRLSRYFEHHNGQMVQKSGIDVKYYLFRHLIDKQSRVVELVSAEPSLDNPKKWRLKFVDYFDRSNVVFIRVDAPLTPFGLT